MASDRIEGCGTKKPTPPQPILILGVGNILRSDEGIGIRVVEAVKEMKLPNNVELLDGGTGAFDLIDLIADREKIIIIDAVDGGCEPGTIYRFSPEDIGAQHYHITSAHEFGLLDALVMAKIASCSPRQIIIYGIEPKRLDWGTELSQEVAAKIPKVSELINSELNNET